MIAELKTVLSLVRPLINIGGRQIGAWRSLNEKKTIHQLPVKP